MLLQNQTAIVSGGLGDIGRAIVRELHSCGASVAIGDIHPASDAQPLLDELGSRARYDRVNVSDAEAVSRWIRTVESSLGVPTLVIPNAAIVTLSGLRELTPAQWKQELSVNLDGAFHLALEAARLMTSRSMPGRIVFIGSWAGSVPHAHIPAYCVSKAALRMLMKQFALEYARDEILVNEVAPGYVDAGLSGRVFEKDPSVRQRAVQEVPIRRLIDPAEVAMQVIHLCDPRNRHMTGSVLLMDGGLSLCK